MIAPRAWHWLAAVALLALAAVAGLVFGVTTIPLGEIAAAITTSGFRRTTSSSVTVGDGLAMSSYRLRAPAMSSSSDM